MPGRAILSKPDASKPDASQPESQAGHVPHAAQAALAALAPIPIDAAGPVFAEPWEAQAFAMAVALNERGAFTWSEWADALAAQISSDPQRPYYLHWLATVEQMVTAKSLATTDELKLRAEDWNRAAQATPHGHPIALP